MTKEQDIVERLENDGASWAQPLFNEAAQTITALRAERDELKEHNQRYAQSQAEATASCARRRCATKERDRDEAEARAEAAETRLKELEHYEELWLGIGVKP